jgi:hypothetical protein
MFPFWALSLLTGKLTKAGRWGSILTSILLLSYIAQPLLEGAVVASQKRGDYLRFSLAEGLLSQNKEAERGNSREFNPRNRPRFAHYATVAFGWSPSLGPN